MAKTGIFEMKDSSWHALSIAIFILVVSIVIGHITTSFKEKFTESTSVTRGKIDRIAPAIDHIENDEENAYKHIFSNRIPTFLDHPCNQECCHDSTALTCSHGCVCLGPEDKQMLNYH